MPTKRARGRRRPAASITMPRAARLFQLVRLLADAPQGRDQIQSGLGIGLRTFYRELELIKRLGVKVRFQSKTYALQTSIAEAETRLPFPDPHLTFAEMRELIGCPGTVGRRLTELFEELMVLAAPSRPRPQRSRRGGRGPAQEDPKPPSP